MLIVILFFFVITFHLFISYSLKENIVFVFLLWFGHFWMALSSAYIESGIYISEQQRFSYYTGSTLYLLFFDSFLWLGFLGGRSLFFNKKEFFFVSINKRKLNIVLSLVFCVLLLLYLNVVISGSPLWNEELTRFNYWENSKLSFLKYIFGEISAPFIVILGVSFSFYVNNRAKYKSFPFVLFVFFLIYYFFIGHKFSAQFLSVTLFFPPILYRYYVLNNGFKIRFKHLIGLSLIVCVVLLSVGYFYSIKHADFVESQGGLFNSILYRFFGLQGHVWWGGVAARDTSNGVISVDVNSVINGLKTLMYVVSPPDLVDTYIDNGVRFTMGYPAIIYYSFGAIITIIFELISGLLMGFLVSYIKKSLLENRFFSSVFSLIILMNVVTVLNMGDFAELFSAKNLLPAFILFFLFINKKRTISICLR